MRFDSQFTFTLDRNALQHPVAMRRWQVLKRWRRLPSYQRRRQARRQRRQFQQQIRRQRYALLRRHGQANWRKTG